MASPAAGLPNIKSGAACEQMAPVSGARWAASDRAALTTNSRDAYHAPNAGNCVKAATPHNATRRPPSRLGLDDLAAMALRSFDANAIQRKIARRTGAEKRTRKEVTSESWTDTTDANHRTA